MKIATTNRQKPNHIWLAESVDPDNNPISKRYDPARSLDSSTDALRADALPSNELKRVRTHDVNILASSSIPEMDKSDRFNVASWEACCPTQSVLAKWHAFCVVLPEHHEV